ncbi:hypothetical protein SK128_015157, partial [Halocaridina rubra]
YSLLPNKYPASGVGSARGERIGTGVGGRRSPLIVSPTLHRRINALAPLEGGDAVITVSRAGSTRNVIPPLSASVGKSAKRDGSRDIPGLELEEDDEEEEEDIEEDRRTDYSSTDDDDDEENDYYEEVEEEVLEEVLIEDDEVSRPMSSATTRDSGISIFSGSNESEALTENGQ